MRSHGDVSDHCIFRGKKYPARSIDRLGAVRKKQAANSRLVRGCLSIKYKENPIIPQSGEYPIFKGKGLYLYPTVFIKTLVPHSFPLPKTNLQGSKASWKIIGKKVNFLAILRKAVAYKTF
jgi:hypothetical protein